MKFELGKYYKHTTGTKLHICGLSDTYYHGVCFVGEDEYGELKPIGNSEDNAVNYSEISKEQFIGKEIEINNVTIVKDINAIINCLFCEFKNNNVDKCDKYNVRIYPNINNAYYDNTFYYPCALCKGRHFKMRGVKVE